MPRSAPIVLPGWVLAAFAVGLIGLLAIAVATSSGPLAFVAIAGLCYTIVLAIARTPA